MPVYYDHAEDAFYLDGFKDGYETDKEFKLNRFRIL
jgi:hypothetical protein